MIAIFDASDLDAKDLEQALSKQSVPPPDVSADVADILAEVRAKGDAALLGYTERFDGVRLSSLRVTAEEIRAAQDEVGEEFRALLSRAAKNIRAFHEKQKRQGFVMAEKPGVVMGQKITAIERVGVYVPGGTAAYPSTVLMNVLPAQIAGVRRIVMVTPPGKDGKVNPAILAAAGAVGVSEIYKVGGAQAIAALAYGTKSVPKVDKIVGPGNLYVATAKRMVYGQVDIDMIAGPSDVLVVADDSANPAFIAADMLAQAEHDENATAVLVTACVKLGEAVRQQIETQLSCLPRQATAAKSIAQNGMVIIARDMNQALEIANTIAPEHLELCTEDPFALLPVVQNAGSIFLGHYTPEALGDYFAGPNHTLPTAGAARFSSPLSVDDFIKKSSYLYYSKKALQKDAADVEAFAQTEGLGAHANSVTLRREALDDRR